MGKFELKNAAMLKVLSDEQILKVHESALDILEHTGVYFYSDECLKILEKAGAMVDYETHTVRFKPELVIESIKKTPESFTLYNRYLEPWAEIGGNNSYYDTGSATIRILESDGQTIRPTLSSDLANISQVVEALDNIKLTSTAITPDDVYDMLGDSYRVYCVLKNSTKPFIAGAFSSEGVKQIHEFLSIAAGGADKLKQYPRIVLDICPTAPLRWSDIACDNILDAAKLDLPIEFISVPMIGASAPMTLAGCVVLHTVETLSGIVMAQAINPGCRIVYGGAPMYFDMQYSTTSLNSIETNLIGTAYAQMGKYYGMPTHTYACLCDAKRVDAQAGLETAISGTIANLSGINIISGVGGMEFINLISLEKLVVDNEICGMAERYKRGIEFTDETLAVDLIKEIGHTGDYISTDHTLDWFRKEPYLPSKVIDRSMIDTWNENGKRDTFELAKEVVADILKNRPTPPLDPAVEKALDEAWENAKKKYDAR